MAYTADDCDRQFKERVLDRYPNLLRSIDVVRVLHSLFQAGAINKKEFDDVSDIRSRIEQLERLLDVLSHGPSSTFDKFCTVMDKEQARLPEIGVLEEQAHVSDQPEVKRETQAARKVSICMLLISNQLHERQRGSLDIVGEFLNF